MPERSLQLDELASLADVVTYAPDEIDEAEAARADDAATAIADTVQARVAAPQGLVQPTRPATPAAAPRRLATVGNRRGLRRGDEDGNGRGRDHSSRLNRSRMR